MKKLFNLSASPNLKVYIFDSKRSWHHKNFDEDNKQVIDSSHWQIVRLSLISFIHLTFIS
jgi:hypothetical protein